MSILGIWQLWPLYAAGLMGWALPRRWKWVRRGVVGALLGAAVGAWMVWPWPRIPEPGGEFGVGTRIFRWVDERRAETAAGAEGERRQVIAQVFYPVDKGAAAGGEEAPYLDGIGALPETVAGVPRALLREAGRVRTHAVLGAAPKAGEWPVVLFSTGYGAPRGYYTTLVTEWASRGMVVVAVDHPYEAGVAQLADGRVVGTRPPRSRGEGDTIAYMAAQQEVRVADLRFVLDRLGEMPGWGARAGRRVVAVGHSFGGAASMGLLSVDARVAAAVNLDGTPYGDLPGRRFDRPVMVVESDTSIGAHGERFREGNGRILAGAAEAYRYRLPGVNHFGFTDLGSFFSPPGRWVVARVLGGGRPGGEVTGAVSALVEAMARGRSVTAAAERFRWVEGGRLPAGRATLE